MFGIRHLALLVIHFLPMLLLLSPVPQRLPQTLPLLVVVGGSKEDSQNTRYIVENHRKM